MDLSEKFKAIVAKEKERRREEVYKALMRGEEPPLPWDAKLVIASVVAPFVLTIAVIAGTAMEKIEQKQIEAAKPVKVMKKDNVSEAPERPAVITSSNESEQLTRPTTN